MKVTILTSSADHPVYQELEQWIAHRPDHEVRLTTSLDEVLSGDVLFLVSCKHLVHSPVRERFGATLIVHASDLPEGRGMSPHIWQILEGKEAIVVTLLEAEDQLDTGRIWAQRTMRFAGHELFDEINEALFDATLELMDEALDGFETILPRDQVGEPSALYRTRSPADSELDPVRSIEEQFDLLRVADSQRFPAFFHHRGTRYTMEIRKAPEP